jgi:glycosyltransferase involved in cell wall biosynthesis
MRRCILLVGPRPPPEGGVATHLGDLARALARAGHAVRRVDPRHDGPDGRVRLLGALARARLEGALVHVHANGHNLKSWYVALACGGGRAVLTVHSGLAPGFIRAHARVVRAAARRYAARVAVNDEIAAALDAVGVGPVEVCPAFSPTSLAFRLAPPGLAGLRRAHRPLLCAALAPGPEYGAPVLLDAFARVHAARPSAGLIVYGPGTRALGPTVRARGLGQAVALLGELDRVRALAVVAAADLFVRPTLADGDALSVREALALGRPVVASDVVARPDPARTFSAGSAAALAEQIFLSCATDGERIDASGFDCVPRLLAIYRRLGVA